MDTNVFDNFIGLKAFHEEMVEFTKYNPDKTVSEAMEAVKLILLHKFNDREMILDSSSIRDCNIKPGDLLAATGEDDFSEFYFVVKSFDNGKINLWILFDSNKININASIWRCHIKNIKFVPDIELGLMCSKLSDRICSYLYDDEFKKSLILSYDLNKYFPLHVFEFNIENKTEKFLYVFSFMHKDDKKIKHVFIREDNGFYIKEEMI